MICCPLKPRGKDMGGTGLGIFTDFSIAASTAWSNFLTMYNGP